MRLWRHRSVFDYFLNQNVWSKCFPSEAFSVGFSGLIKRSEIINRAASVKREITMCCNCCLRGIEYYSIIPIVFLQLGKHLNFVVILIKFYQQFQKKLLTFDLCPLPRAPTPLPRAPTKCIFKIPLISVCVICNTEMETCLAQERLGQTTREVARLYIQFRLSYNDIYFTALPRAPTSLPRRSHALPRFYPIANTPFTSPAAAEILPNMHSYTHDQIICNFCKFTLLYMCF